MKELRLNGDWELRDERLEIGVSEAITVAGKAER